MISHVLNVTTQKTLIHLEVRITGTYTSKIV